MWWIAVGCALCAMSCRTARYTSGKESGRVELAEISQREIAFDSLRCHDWGASTEWEWTRLEAEWDTLAGESPRISVVRVKRTAKESERQAMAVADSFTDSLARQIDSVKYIRHNSSRRDSSLTRVEGITALLIILLSIYILRRK